MKGTLTLLAAAALLLSSASASATAQATFSSVSIQNVDAKASLTGLLAAPAQGTIPFREFSADQVVGGIDVKDAQVVVGGAEIQPSGSQEPLNLASVSLQENHASYDSRLVIIGGTQATITQLNGDVRLGAQNIQETRRATVTQIIETIQAAGLPVIQGSGMVAITGNFTIGLWSINATLIAHGGQTPILTGFNRQPYATVPGVPRGVEHTTSREAWLRVTNGHLLLDLTDFQLPTNDASLSLGDGKATLHGATGTINVAGKSIGLTGNDVLSGGTLSIAAVGNALAGSFSAPDGATINGVSVKPSGGSGVAAWLSLLLFGALLLVVAFAAFARGRMHKLLAAKDYTGALSWSKLIWSWPWLAEDATISAAVCMLQLGRLEDAKRELGRHMWRDRPRPGRLYLYARIAAQEGDEKEARQYLADCVSLSPSYATDALADAVLGPLLRRHGLGTEAGSYV